jgi:hypothetical protein
VTTGPPLVTLVGAADDQADREDEDQQADQRPVPARRRGVGVEVDVAVGPTVGDGSPVGDSDPDGDAVTDVCADADPFAPEGAVPPPPGPWLAATAGFPEPPGRAE